MTRVPLPMDRPMSTPGASFSGWGLTRKAISREFGSGVVDDINPYLCPLEVKCSRVSGLLLVVSLACHSARQNEVQELMASQIAST